jgi:hypothetical protein
MSSPRVLVVMPTRGYAYAPSLLRAVDLAKRFGHELVLEIGRPIELVRTRLMTRFLESQADYVLTIDDDVVAPEDAPQDAVDRMLALNAPVATAAYPIMTDTGLVWGVKAAGTDDWLSELPGHVFPVRHTGLGFTLIHRDVFARIRKPWFQFGAAPGGRMVGEDTWFCNGVTQAGLEILCDGSIRCSHFKDGLDLSKLAR